MTTSDCLFCRIVAGEIPATVVAENEHVLAFQDIAPQAPTHVLLVPKQHYRDAAALVADRPELAAELISLAAQVAEAQGISSDGYRLLFNTGSQAGQTVFHAHLHLLGGRQLGALG